MFFFGQFVSSSLKGQSAGQKWGTACDYFVISLDSTMRFSSLTTNGPTHTGDLGQHSSGTQNEPPTFFTDQAVIPIIRVVRISKTTMGVLKLQEFMAVFS